MNSRFIRGSGLVALLLLLGGLYLMPGTSALLEGRTDTVMGDDTDIAGLPYIYDQVRQLFFEHPSWLFYGSVYLEHPDPERGFSYWMPWMERWASVVVSSFVPMEQMTTAMALFFMLLNGITMYALARYLRWNYWIALGLALAWAFSPFTRARAKVHTAMTGIYHVPLIFLALLLIARGRSWKSLALAATALLLACTTIHYFIVTSAFLAPFFLLFLAWQPETRANWKRVSARMALAALPTIAFLGLNFLYPVPPTAKITGVQAYPKSGETSDGGIHPYLHWFAARPLDYLGSDISLAPTPADLNPLRSLINGAILSDLGKGNAHERTNGIRWSLLLVALAAIWTMRRAPDRSWYYFFILFGGFAFWLSLSPDFPFAGMGPSGWLYQLVSQVRVPCRAGILVHFSVLMIAGYWLSTRAKKNWLLLPAVFPLLMVADYPPLVQAMPMAPMRPAYTELERERGGCGVGMYFPFVSNWHANVMHYWFLQRMRGSDCSFLNGMMDPEHLFPVAERFPVELGFLQNLEKNLVVSEQVARLAECVPLSFIAFEEHVPPAWSMSLCARLGWSYHPDRTCVAPQRDRPMQRLPHTCL